MGINPNVQMTLDDAVQEVWSHLHGLDLRFTPESDRYYATTRHLNRALRLHALEVEWSYYSDVETVGKISPGVREIWLPSSVRPRIIGDDAVRLVDSEGTAREWAYFLPRDALHKYPAYRGLRCAVTKNTLVFNRTFTHAETGLDIQVPVMREPRMFDLPPRPEDPNDPVLAVPQSIRDQVLDYDYPDVVILRAATLYAMSDPVLQPRVQTLEDQWKDMMYQLKERDERNTDSPYQNDFVLPIQATIHGNPATGPHRHPHSDDRGPYDGW